MTPAARLHLSVDDVLDALLRAAADGLDDPFEAPGLSRLRSLHARYGAAFDLYLFAASPAGGIEDVPERFAPHFAAASGWLRFGFHARDEGTTYGRGGASAADAVRDLERVRANVLRFAGAASWTSSSRLHRFLGTRGVVRALRAAPGGPAWLLTPDDDRPEAYALAPATREAVRARGAWRDPSDGTRYAASLRRLEADPDPVATARAHLARVAAAGDPALACAFTHEPFLADPEVVGRLERLVAWAAGEGLRFGFLPAGGDQAGSSPPVSAS